MRYFIAALVEGDVGIKIHELKEEISKEIGVMRALETLPHITFHPPFEIRPSAISELTSRLSNTAKRTKAFSAELNGFGNFDQRVWFVDIKPSDGLSSLKREVMRIARPLVSVRLDPRKERDPHFHVTVAFNEGDQSQAERIPGFLQAKAFREELEINHLALLQWTGSGWILDRAFEFGVRR